MNIKQIDGKKEIKNKTKNKKFKKKDKTTKEI